MKRVCVAVALLVVLAGCTFAAKTRDNIAACAADPDCDRWADNKSGDLAQKAAIAATFIPAPGGPLAAQVTVKIISLLVFLAIGGTALTKKKETTS